MARRKIMATVGMSLVLGAVWAFSGPAAAAAPVAQGPAAPTPTQAWVGRVVAPVVARAAPRRSAKAKMVVPPIAPFAQGPTTLLVTRAATVDGVRWAEVLLPVRPNGTRGWVPADVLSLTTTPMRIAVDLSERRLKLFRSGKSVFTARIAVGTPSTPTPTGTRFAIAELVRTRTPGGFLGPIVLPLTGYSETLNEFAGGNGRVAMHGTSQPSLIGSAVSHGCMRMTNADIVRLASLARPGTPVTISP